MRSGQPTRFGSLRRRIVAATALISTIGVATLVGLLVLLVDRSTDREIASTLSARISAVLATTSVEDGRLEVDDVNDALYDTLTWVYTSDGTMLQGPHIPASLRGTVDDLAQADSGRTESTRAEPTRYRTAGRWDARARPIRIDGDIVGTVVVAVDTGSYRSLLEKTALAGAALGGGAIAGMTVLSALIVRRALAPVSTMTTTADAWSHDHLEQRFALGRPRDEITALGAVLDRLLDRVDAAIRAEQRLTAELAHELRTPLTVIQGEADLGRTGDAASAGERFDRIAAAATDMGAAMTTLLDAARGSSGIVARASVADAVRAVVARQQHDPSTIRLHLIEADVLVPQELVERILAPVVDNAVRYAAAVVEVTISAGNPVAVDIRNDGPPIEGDNHFTPGVRAADSPGAGLGLPLARRLARAAGGDVRIAALNPAAFTITLPGTDRVPD